MGLEKAILYGKEHRKPYYDSRAVSGECRNHGGYPWCTGNKLYSFENQKQAAIQKIKYIYKKVTNKFSKNGFVTFCYL